MTVVSGQINKPDKTPASGAVRFTPCAMRVQADGAGQVASCALIYQLDNTGSFTTGDIEPGCYTLNIVLDCIACGPTETRTVTVPATGPVTLDSLLGG